MTDAVDFLVAARQAGQAGKRMPEAIRPTDSDAAFTIQEGVTAKLGLEVGGWKCLLPFADKVIAAPIYTVNIKSDHYAVKSVSAAAEPEIAIVVGQDLPPKSTPYTEEEIKAAIKEFRLVLEMLGSRYTHPADCTQNELLADGLQNDGMVVGPVIDQPFDKNLSQFPLILSSAQGEIASFQGKHPNQHPFPPFAWLVNFLNTRGTGLKAGQIVTTGSYAGVVHAPVNIPLQFKYGDLGVLKIEFTR